MGKGSKRRKGRIFHGNYDGVFKKKCKCEKCDCKEVKTNKTESE